MSELPLEPLAPPLAISTFIVCVAGTAALADCAIFATLLKRRLCTGLFSIIIQLTIADFLLLATTAGPELWSLNLRTWQFGTTGCVAYQGFNVFTSTLSTYLLIAITLHTLTTISLEEKATVRRIKRNNRDEEEIRSSQHSLVANSDSSTPPRTMNVDYRMANTGVPVTLPTISVWILSTSLSIPEFALATVVYTGKSNVSICTLDNSHMFNVYSMLGVFNLFLPLFLISIASAMVIVKIKTNNKAVPGVLDCSEYTAALKLSLWLMCVHILFCAPRSVVSAYLVYSSSISGYEFADLPLHGDMVAIINLALSSTNLAATLIRPVICIRMLPQLRIFHNMFSHRTSEV